MKTFDEMSREEKLELLTAWVDGVPIEYLDSFGVWVESNHPVWGGTYYRVKPVVQDSINWSHVHEDFKYMARDAGGIAYLYKYRPELGSLGWNFRLGGTVEVRTLSSYKRGDTDWKDSLVCRP